MMVAVPNPREVLLSGRLSRIPEIEEALVDRLSLFAPVRRVRRRAQVAKEAAEGACILGDGLRNGQYRGIVDSLELRAATGTMFDYIRIKGASLEKS